MIEKSAPKMSGFGKKKEKWNWKIFRAAQQIKQQDILIIALFHVWHIERLAVSKSKKKKLLTKRKHTHTNRRRSENQVKCKNTLGQMVTLSFSNETHWHKDHTIYFNKLFFFLALSLSFCVLFSLLRARITVWYCALVGTHIRRINVKKRIDRRHRRSFYIFKFPQMWAGRVAIRLHRLNVWFTLRVKLTGRQWFMAPSWNRNISKFQIIDLAIFISLSQSPVVCAFFPIIKWTTYCISVYSMYEMWPSQAIECGALTCFIA